VEHFTFTMAWRRQPAVWGMEPSLWGSKLRGSEGGQYWVRRMEEQKRTLLLVGGGLGVWLRDASRNRPWRRWT